MENPVPTFKEMYSQEVILLVRGGPFADHYLQVKMSEEQFENMMEVFRNEEGIYPMELFNTKLSIVPYEKETKNEKGTLG